MLEILKSLTVSQATKLFFVFLRWCSLLMTSGSCFPLYHHQGPLLSLNLHGGSVPRRKTSAVGTLRATVKMGRGAPARVYTCILSCLLEPFSLDGFFAVRL